MWYAPTRDEGRAKKLTKFIKRSVGRNNYGKITVRSKKTYGKKYKTFFANSFYLNSIRGCILTKKRDSLERSTYKPTATYKNNYGTLFYYPGEILANNSKLVGNNLHLVEETNFLKRGDMLNIGQKGSMVFSNSNPKYVISSGSFFIVLRKDQKNIVIKMPSGKIKTISCDSFYKDGPVFFQKKKQIKYGSAGFSFKILNKKSSVRGVAKNPVDHPHGGGEGKKSGIKKSPQGYYNGLKKKKHL